MEVLFMSKKNKENKNNNNNKNNQNNNNNEKQNNNNCRQLLKQRNNWGQVKNVSYIMSKKVIKNDNIQQII